MNSKKNKFRFSKTEIKEMLFSAAVLSLVFMESFNDATFIIDFLTSFLFVGLAFILHETAHKLTAQNFGVWAEYRMWAEGLFLALVLHLMDSSFVFAAPGAAYYSPFIGGFGLRLNKKQEGKIALAGPITNLALAFLFSILSKVIGFRAFFFTGISINTSLALFNLLPIPPMDGEKIMRANFSNWVLVFIYTLISPVFL